MPDASASTRQRKRKTGKVYCTKHGRPLYLQPEGVAICLSGCRLDLNRKAPHIVLTEPYPRA